MRPNPESLPRAGRLHAPVPLLRGCGCPPHLRTANALRTKLLHTKAHRPSLPFQPGQSGSDQKRWITQQHIRRMEEARLDWLRRAKEIKDGKRQSFIEHLESRGLIHDVVGDRDQLHRLLTEKRVGFYAGVDPTGPSLHVGHMLPFMILAWAYVWGLPAHFLLGGSTARIGDPTGRKTTREQEHSSVRRANVASMHIQLKRLGASIESYGARHGYKRQWVWRRALTNNNTWWNKQSAMEWIRDMGTFVRLGPMLGRETVKNRLNSSEGMSFAEFCYPLMQAWDWWVLFRKGVQVQVGGSDQYGNILFGMECVKQASRNTALQEEKNLLTNELDRPLGITTPLLTAPNGEKIGKSGGNGIWLDQEMTPTFELYQYFVRTPDDAVERYLKLFTFLPLPKIEKIMERQNQDPSKRVAQHALAGEFVELIHGKNEANLVSRQHRQLFGSGDKSDGEEVAANPDTGPPADYKSQFREFANRAAGNKFAPPVGFSNIGSLHVTLPRSLVFNRAFGKVLYSAGMVNSRSESHRLIMNGGAHVGGASEGTHRPELRDEVKYVPIREGWDKEKTNEFVVDDEFMLLRVGKWKHKIVKIISDDEFKNLGLDAPGWNSGMIDDVPGMEGQK